MKKLGWALVLTLSALPLAAGEHRHSGWSDDEDRVSMRGARDAQSCADIEFTFDGASAPRSEDKVTVAGKSLSLRLRDSRGIPVKVAGSARGDYQVSLCKAADANANLSSIRLEQRGTEISVAGPDNDQWAGYLLVSAPRDGQLRVDAGNGPVALVDLGGQLDAKLSNGPISLRNIGGRAQIETENGPVSLTGGSGDVTINATNGPLSIKLAGASWEGGELHATTKNGPLTLHVPQNYGSGVVVERGSHSPYRCASEICGGKVAKWNPMEPDENRKIEFGSGAPRVHLASTNGPVSIKEATR